MLWSVEPRGIGLFYIEEIVDFFVCVFSRQLSSQCTKRLPAIYIGKYGLFQGFFYPQNTEKSQFFVGVV